MLKEKVLVLSLSVYDFKNDDGEIVKGTTVHYVGLKNDGSRDTLIGLKPAKSTLPFDNFQIHSKEVFPAFVDMDFNLDFSTGKIKPVSFNYLSELSLNGQLK